MLGSACTTMSHDTCARVILFAPNWLGDAIMALPAMAAVRRHLPAASVEIAARPAIAPLFALAPEAGSVVTIDARSAVEGIRRGQYDTAILFPNSFNAAWLAQRAGVPARWGYATAMRSPLLTRAVPPLLGLHQVEYYRRLVALLGFPVDAAPPVLAATTDGRAAGEALLAAEGWDGSESLIAVAPGAAFGTAKRWPSASFARVIDELGSGGTRTVLIGSAADRSAGDDVLEASTLSRRPINLIGRTDLSTLSGVLVRCRALLTNDSGAMHFAAALGLNTSAVIGPTRERETAAVGSGRHAVLTHPVWCRPCMLRECPLDHQCMRGVRVDTVLASTRRAL
jgi:heptosyltransferase-2